MNLHRLRTQPQRNHFESLVNYPESLEDGQETNPIQSEEKPEELSSDNKEEPEVKP